MNDAEAEKSSLVKAVEQLKVHDHLCLIYESLDEQLAAAIPFIRIGLERGEQCIYIADDNTVSAISEAMRAEGIAVDPKSDALKIITKRDAYLKQGYFDPDSMIRFLKEAVDAAKKAGFTALRATGEMTWALGNETGVERLIEYEAKLNHCFPENDALAICQYSRNRFNPEIILDVIRTHPMVIYGSTVCDNFYYVPPDEFLKPEAMQGSLEVERFLENIRDHALAMAEIRKLNAELEHRVKERTAELTERNAQLERMNKLFVGREHKMIALKKRIAELEKDNTGEAKS
ncbi:MAG: MEDS domain-containing protein [Candidatus Latescibacterota bacterium]